MIPLNDGSSDGNSTVCVNKYTIDDIYYDYNKYSVVKVPTNNDSKQYLYTSQVKKTNNKDNKFVMTYVPKETEFYIVVIPEHFEMSIENCGLDVLTIPSSLIFVDENKNIINSLNNLKINFQIIQKLI